MKLFIPDTGDAGGPGTGSAVADPPSSPNPPTAISPPEGGVQPPPPASLIPPTTGVGTPPAGALGDDWINEDGSFRQGWYQRFPEEMQVPLAKYKSVEELAKGHANAQAFIGKKGIFLPTDKSTPEEVADFRKAIGVPETPEAYQIKPDVLPEGMQWSDDLAKPFLAVAHKHNVSQAALKELSAAFTQMEALKGRHIIDTAQAQHAQKIQEGTAQLQEVWKGDFERNKIKAQQAAIMWGIPLDDFGLLSPKVVAGLVRAANDVSEDKLIGATSGLDPVLNSKAMALDIVNNPSNPRHRLYHDGDPDTQAVVREYFRQGTKKAA